MENVMLDAHKKNIKLIDFGLSNVWTRESPLQTHCGSPEYAAPELFVVGKTYGPEIDIWSLGVIFYAMILGRLPFRTPFKDEYQRQRMLDQIQKGLGAFHDREMSALTPDCRHMLKRIIEPDPKQRISLADIEHHPWITRNGKLPFTPYVPQPTDKNMKNQTVSELAIMMGLKRKAVGETVKENKADELSSMFNMILDEKKKNLGLLDKDHTVGKVRTRPHSHDRDGLRGVKSPVGSEPGKGKGKGQGKKVPNKSSTATSTAGAASGKTVTETKTKGERSASITEKKVDLLTVEPYEPSSQSDKAHMVTDSELAEKASADKSKEEEEDKSKAPLMASIVAAAISAAASTTPSTTTTSSPTLSKKAAGKHPGVATPPATTAAATPTTGAAAAGGGSGTGKSLQPPTANGPTSKVTQRRHGPLNLTLDLSVTNLTDLKPDRNPTTKIPVEEGGKSTSPLITVSDAKSIAQALKPLRPSTLVYRPTPASSRTLPVQKLADNKATGAIPKVCVVGAPVVQEAELIAPKATPEDLSTLTTVSSSSSEDVNLEPSMQTDKPLNVSRTEEEKKLLRFLRKEPPGGAKVAPLTKEHLTQKDIADQAAFDASDAKFKEMSMRNILLLKHLSDSERLDDSGSQVSRSSRDSGSHTLHGGSGTLQTSSADNTLKRGSELPSNTCLLPKSGSEPLSGAQSGSHDRLLDNEHAGGGSNPGPLALHSTEDLGECAACGISPSSPTYLDRHRKWCHTGAHALDVFTSPDDNPGSPDSLWNAVASTSQGIATASPSFCFPKVGAGTPRVPMQTSLIAGVAEGWNTDDEDEDEDSYCSKPLLPRGLSSPPHLPRPLSAATGASVAMKRTPSDTSHGGAERRSSRGSSRDRHKKYSAEGGYLHAAGGMPEQTLRLDPVGAASSDSLSGESHCSRDGDGSDDRLASGISSTAHPPDAEKGDEDELIKPSKSRIPRPAEKLRKFQKLGQLLQSGDKGTKEDEPNPPSPQHKQAKGKSLLKQHENKLSWRQGLSHLLRRSKSSSSSTNNNVSVLRGKHSNSNSTTGNGTTGNSVSNKRPSGGDRESYLTGEADANKINPPSSSSPAHKCNSTTIQVSSASPVPSNSSSPVHQATHVCDSLDESSSSPHRSKHRQLVGWTGCKECAKSDQSSDEGQEMTLRLETHIGGSTTASLIPVPQANDTSPSLRATSQV